VELAQEWRQDKAMRKLEAMLFVRRRGQPDAGFGHRRSHRARRRRDSPSVPAATTRWPPPRLAENTQLSAAEIPEKALRIAASICVYTNDHIITEIV
jgi:ATP-dependent HslUV protease subunit HslV